MSTKPEVTVAIPLYQGRRTIRRAVQSIQSQTYRDFEILVIDDGSSDGSAELVESLRVPQLRLLRNEFNKGLGFSRNRLLDEARGKYIAWLDQDDWSVPKRLELQMEVLLANPSVVLCSSWCHFMAYQQKTGMRKGSTLESPKSKLSLFTVPTSRQSIQVGAGFFNPFSTSVCMISRAAALEGGVRFREAWAPAEDYGFWCELVKSGVSVILRKSLGVLESSESGASATGRQQQLKAAAEIGRAYLCDVLGFSISDASARGHESLTQRPERLRFGDERDLAVFFLREILRQNQQKGLVPRKALEFWIFVLTQRLIRNSSVSQLEPELKKALLHVLRDSAGASISFAKWKLSPKLAPR